MNYRRLPLEGLYNVRDLGGHPVPGGGATRFGRFIRSALPQGATDSDLAFLKDYGVTVSIDFRGDREVERQPSCFDGLPWIKYLRSPTFNAQVAFAAKASVGSSRPAMDAFVKWGEKYIELTDDCRDWVCATLTMMAASDGAVIYNCTTGKDRTGLISALLLGLAGVDYADIIADYCVSEVYLTAIYNELIAAYLARWPDREAKPENPFFKTAPENMSVLLAHLDGKYGGIEPYIRACGVGDDTIAKLRRQLI